MKIFLTILLVLAMLATVGMLVRGIIAFLQATEADLKAGDVSRNAVRQNKAMQGRIMFQAIAVIIAVLLLMLSRG